LKYLRDIESDKIIRFILGTSVILLVFSFILPFPIVLFVQDMLFFSYDHLLFIRPRLAYSGMTIGMIVIALAMLSFLATKILSEKGDKVYRWTLPHLIVFVFGFVLMGLALNHYYFLEEGRVVENGFFSFSEEEVSLSEVVELRREVKKENYEVISYTFDRGDKELKIPYDSRDPDASQAIYYLIDLYEWELEDVFIE